MNLNGILNKEQIDKDDICFLLNLKDSESIEKVRSKAYNVMLENVGEKVYLRGLIEFSNNCINDCFYCGIRKSNQNIKRYTLSKEEILESALWAAENGYGSIVLQSGERNDEKFINQLVDIIKEIKDKTISDTLPKGLGITLCIGEQSYNTYRRLYEAGAHRYLLRIETSNPELYRKLHPLTQSYEKRVESLHLIKEAGFQLGTGVMIGIPEQTIEDLANDLEFFKEIDADMIGMGPFIVHSDTIYKEMTEEYNAKKREIYQLSLLMIACARIYLKDVNIASTTALQALYPVGREMGLLFGANVIMPLLTPTYVRSQYQLYNGKPCIDEFSTDCYDCIINRIKSINRPIAYNEWGDSPHYKK